MQDLFFKQGLGKTSLLHFAVKVNTTKCSMLLFFQMGGGGMYSRLRDLREDHDMKQRELAAYLNCSQQVYSNYELGQRDIPTDVLIRLSALYHVSTDYILGLTNIPQQNQ